MKLIEHVSKERIRKMMDIDEMQFGFASGRNATDTVFIVRQFQQIYIVVKKQLLFFFEAFSRVSCKMIWLATRKLGVELLAVRVVQRMYFGGESSTHL